VDFIAGYQWRKGHHADFAAGQCGGCEAEIRMVMGTSGFATALADNSPMADFSGYFAEINDKFLPGPCYLPVAFHETI
jgi:hypothetical protein